MSDPDHTSDRLVAAAERLFADGGEETTSLRAITRQARSNAAAVHYHYGGRDELLRAVIDRYLQPLAELRTELLGRDDAARANDRVAVVVEAMVRPDLELLASLRGERVQVARLLGRAYTLPGAAVAELVARRFAELVGEVLPALREALPSVDEGQLRQRLALVRATVAFLFASAAPSGQAPPLGSEEVDEQVRRLVAFAAAGLSAPVSAGLPRITSGPSKKPPLARAVDKPVVKKRAAKAVDKPKDTDKKRRKH